MPRAPRLSKPADPLNLLAIIKVSSISDSGVALKNRKSGNAGQPPYSIAFLKFVLRFFARTFCFPPKKIIRQATPTL
jgi:hypothetical protein